MGGGLSIEEITWYDGNIPGRKTTIKYLHKAKYWWNCYYTIYYIQKPLVQEYINFLREPWRWKLQWPEQHDLQPLLGLIPPNSNASLQPWRNGHHLQLHATRSEISSSSSQPPAFPEDKTHLCYPSKGETNYITSSTSTLNYKSDWITSSRTDMRIHSTTTG